MSAIYKIVSKPSKYKQYYDLWKMELCKLFKWLIEEWRRVLKYKKHDAAHTIAERERLNPDWQIVDFGNALDVFSKSLLTKKERTLK